MSPALSMHPGMAPHLQQLQAHLLRNAAVAALMPHSLQPPAPPPPHPHSHPHSHGLTPHNQLFVPPHSSATTTVGPHHVRRLLQGVLETREFKDALEISYR
ncbi:hypothetical protein G9C98_004372 [Cotesia typhae]|uniref:Uncharacterized protein n=1 Tax=Cotesia typhae TaxID=2053667 RepID=A0A8J5UUD6_9HYME|nr:hypothetical protein G9C98_004372 [Cotesia typhae]